MENQLGQIHKVVCERPTGTLPSQPKEALCDIGASINLTLNSIFNQLGIGQAIPTVVNLQLVDRSLVHPERRINDILMQVYKFVFPANFIISYLILKLIRTFISFWRDLSWQLQELILMYTKQR